MEKLVWGPMKEWEQPKKKHTSKQVSKNNHRRGQKQRQQQHTMIPGAAAAPHQHSNIHITHTCVVRVCMFLHLFQICWWLKTWKNMSITCDCKMNSATQRNEPKRKSTERTWGKKEEQEKKNSGTAWEKNRAAWTENEEERTNKKFEEKKLYCKHMSKSLICTNMKKKDRNEMKSFEAHSSIYEFLYNSFLVGVVAAAATAHCVFGEDIERK